MCGVDPLKLRVPNIIGEENARTYSVLVPLIKEENQWYILFEKRTQNLRKNPGEICFPGGKVEVGESYQQCAIRETMEELSIEEEQIQMLGPGDIYMSPFQLKLHPYIGILRNYKDTFSKDEVDSIIKIPIEYLQNEKPKLYKSKLVHQPGDDFPYEWIPNGEKYPWVTGIYPIYFYHYEEHIIWGMTGNILYSVLNLLEEYDVMSSL